jgi:hypothetical protein
LHPTSTAKSAQECPEVALGRWCSPQEADPSHPLTRLRARRERPRGRAAEQRDEFAALYLIELHSVPASQGGIAGYRIGGE